MAGSRTVERYPAIALVGAGALSVQFGAAMATELFGRVGPAGAVTLRIVIAAVILLALTRVARPARSARAAASPGSHADGRVVRSSLGDRAVAAGFGVVLAGMNLSFYEAIARIPLGVAVTLEFSGPLALALVASRRWLDALWGTAAGAGVALLATGAGRHLDLGGLALALLAGLFWIGYILLSQETGRRFESLTGLAWAMTAAGLAVAPFGLVAGGTTLLRPSVLGLGAAVALLSSVIPYSLELLALRRVTARAFGVMMSLDPAAATAAGFLVLGQRLTAREWIALALVAGANLGNTITGRPRALEDAVVATTP